MVVASRWTFSGRLRVTRCEITPAAVAVMIERYTRPDAEPPGR